MDVSWLSSAQKDDFPYLLKGSDGLSEENNFE